MITREIEQACRVLDLDFQALDIKILKERYWALLKIYRSESLASLPLAEELGEEERDRQLKEIESSYRLLESFCAGEKNPGTQPEAESFANPLKNVRNLKSISLEELAAKSGLSAQQIGKLEQERFDQLPPLTYLKLFLGKLAPLLGVSPEKLVRYYEKKYQDWRGDSPPR